MRQKHRRVTSIAVSMALLLSACGGGGGSGPKGGGGGGGGPAHLYNFPAHESLSVDDVKQVLSQAIAEAAARSLPSVIAITDRMGNVLAVYDMTGAKPTAKIPDAPAGAQADVDLEGQPVPAEAAAISKAITGAYLSSGGHAFTTRTASMIVQQNFPPGPNAKGLEGGPLFGVQLSSLTCSDLVSHYDSRSKDASAFIGPKDSPLGLSADPGGFPLYKNGVVVGGVGVMGDGDYSFDPDAFDVDVSDEEAIALAATFGFDAPVGIRADRISIDGTTLRYSDMTPASLKSNPANAPPFDSLPPNTGAVTAVSGFFGGGIIAGRIYGTERSGIRPANAAEFNNIDAFILTDGSGNNRYPVRAGTDAAEVSVPLSKAEVTDLLEEAFKIMSRARAQIRQPLNSRAQVTISVVDTRGEALGLVRSPDGALFGIDVSLQKARTASFFSSPYGATDLLNDKADGRPAGEVPKYVMDTQTFLRDARAFTGDYAFSVRGVGNIARPFFPDGQNGTRNGSLSLPITVWSPFATGLQSALVVGTLGMPQCTTLGGQTGPNRLKNGMQIFAGGVPIYRGNELIGGIGVSGDGIDQDDLIAFLGLYNAGKRSGTINEAPGAIRDDDIVVHTDAGNTRLRYVNCPFAPFLDSPDQNVCEGI